MQNNMGLLKFEGRFNFFYNLESNDFVSIIEQILMVSGMKKEERKSFSNYKIISKR